MTKHTPGPWKVMERWRGLITIVDPSQALARGQLADLPTDGLDTPLVKIVGGMRDHDENIANAHLIATAPDLLAVCKLMVDEWDNGDDDSDWPRIIDNMRIIIAKAEGDTHA